MAGYNWDKGTPQVSSTEFSRAYAPLRVADSTAPDDPTKDVLKQTSVQTIIGASATASAQAAVSALAATTGAANVGANDGASGAAWTTVQGFIGKIVGSTGSTFVQFLSSASSSVIRSVGFVLDLLSITPETFGATANNSSVDNSGALNLWLAAAAAGRPVRLPNKSYYFKGSLVCAVANDIEITGRGQLIYNGTNTTRDLLTFGSTSVQSIRLRLCGLRMSSLTTMTAGTALRFDKVYRSTLRDIILDGQDGTGNFWNGLWFNGCDVNTLSSFQLTAANDALRINDGSDLFLDDGKICPADNPSVALRGTACGFRIGGGFGGVYHGSVDIIGCDVNEIVDNTLSSAPNREIAFSGTSALDSSKTGANLYLNETSGAPVYIVGAGAWFASAATDNISIAASTSAYHIFLSGGRIYNAARDGIRNNGALATICVSGAEILGNSGYGINNVAASVNVTTIGCTYSSNTLGDTNGIVMDPVRPLVLSVANGASAAIPGTAGQIVITLADGGAHTAVYVFGGGGVAMLGTTNSIFVAPTTAPAAGKVSFAYSGSGSIYNIYNNSGAAVRVQAIINRTA